MQKITRALLLTTLVCAAAPALAADAPAAAAPAPDYTLTSNVGFVSDYYFRGLTQTWHKPAVQGGADFTHSSGLYAGVWGSSVSGNEYANGAGLEFDYYGGYNGTIGDFGYTAGLYGYYYPGSHFNTPNNEKYNTLEFNVGASYKWISVKYSQAITDYFGANTNTGFTGNSKGTNYIEANVAYPIMDDLSLNLHVGHTNYKNKLAAPLASGATDPDYTDYKIGVTKTFTGGWNVGAAYAKSTNEAFYNATSSANNATDTQDLGKGRFIVSAGRTF
jgi:uncharacterized protein (TIGR02001 family)